jgi:hypothetical protein
MSTLIPECQFADFNKLNAAQLKRLKCCEVFDGADYLFSFIRPTTDFIRAQSENNGQLSNSVGGEDLPKILGESPPSVTTATQETTPEIYVSEHPYKSKRNKKKV